MSEKGFVASLKMKALQPRIKDIQDRFKDDPMQKNQAIMALYKEEAVNPMGGCLPLLLQFPFLIALYWVLVESVQLRHTVFMDSRLVFIRSFLYFTLSYGEAYFFNRS